MRSPRLVRATLLFNQRRFLEAESELRAALDEGDSSADVHALLGLCLLHANLVDEAKREVEKALSLEPNDPYGHYALSFVFEKKLRFTRAFGRPPTVVKDSQSKGCMESARRALELAPDQPRYLIRMAEIQYRFGRWRETVRLAEQALQLSPENVLATIVLARGLAKMRKHSKARALLARALEINPEESIAHADMGWALLRARDFRRAKTFFEESLRLNSNLSWAQEGALECAKHEYSLYRWGSYFREWLESLHPLLAIPVGLLILGLGIVMIIAVFGVVVPFVDSHAGTNAAVILCFLFFGSAVVFLFFRDPILLFLIRRHSAAQTTVGQRHRNAAIGRIVKIVLGLGAAVLVGLLGNSKSICTAILCGLVPGAASFWIAWRNFKSGMRRKIWLGYGAFVMAAGALAGILLWRRIDEWPPALTFLTMFVFVVPPVSAVEIEKKRSPKKEHAQALAALSRKQKQ